MSRTRSIKADIKLAMISSAVASVSSEEPRSIGSGSSACAQDIAPSSPEPERSAVTGTALAALVRAVLRAGASACSFLFATRAFKSGGMARGNGSSCHAHAPSTSPLNEIYSSPEVCIEDFSFLLS